MTQQQTSHKRGWLRQKLLVNEHFQLRFIAFAGLTSLFSSGLFFGAMFMFFSRYTQMATQVGIGPSNPLFRIFSNMQDHLTTSFAIVTIVTIAFTIIAGLIFSNRVAGPMYRLARHCDEVSDGKTLEGLTFRHGDYFEEVADSYNRQMESVRCRLGVTSKQAQDSSLHKKTA